MVHSLGASALSSIACPILLVYMGTIAGKSQRMLGVTTRMHITVVSQVSAHGRLPGIELPYI